MNTYADLSPSHILFASPSFLGGFGSILDWGNTLFEYNQSLDGKQADYFATKADWIAVGNDLRWAVGKELDSDPVEAPALGG